MNRTHRIVALLGAGMALIAIVTMLAGAFLPGYRALLMNISLMTIVAALGVLVCLTAIRKRMERENNEETEDEA